MSGTTSASRRAGPAGGLLIRPSDLEAIRRHGEETWPHECCGLLLGSEGEIEERVAAANLRRSAVAFLVDPADHFAAIRTARARGRAVIGAYHSHPGSPAVPSPTDIAEANDPAFVHVIVSLAASEADVRAYRIRGGQVEIVVLQPDR